MVAPKADFHLSPIRFNLIPSQTSGFRNVAKRSFGGDHIKVEDGPYRHVNLA